MNMVNPLDVSMMMEQFKGEYGQSVGHIDDDGTVKGEYGQTVGHIDDDGTVKGEYGQTLGHIDDDGTVKDEYGQTIGSSEGVSKKRAGYQYFFNK